MVTIVLSVSLHKAFHEVHSSHMGSLGQQVPGETPAETHVSVTEALIVKRGQNPTFKVQHIY